MGTCEHGSLLLGPVRAIGVTGDCRGLMGLEMRAICESCSVPVWPDGPALICSYECTFCPRCASRMGMVCPNCAGNLVTRPLRRPKS
ncbi:MAG: DUF1272 domain-containing protein [Thermoplasmata archaeon]